MSLQDPEMQMSGKWDWVGLVEEQDVDGKDHLKGICVYDKN